MIDFFDTAGKLLRTLAQPLFDSETFFYYSLAASLICVILLVTCYVYPGERK